MGDKKITNFTVQCDGDYCNTKTQYFGGIKTFQTIKCRGCQKESHLITCERCKKVIGYCDSKITINCDSCIEKQSE